jgi:glutathionylspermidine synthase
MKQLSKILTSDTKSDFFRYLSTNFCSNLPADLLTIFEGNEEDRRPYIAFDTIQVSEHFCDTIRTAAENFGILAKAYSEIVSRLPIDEICDYGLPEDYVPFVLGDVNPPCEMRLDIAVNPDAFSSGNFHLSDFKVIEANSATPGLWFETFELNQLVCDYFGKKCPNKDLAEVQSKDFVSYLNLITKNNFDKKKDTLYLSFPYSGNHEDILSFYARQGYLEKLGIKCKFIYTSQIVIETDPMKDTVMCDDNGNIIKFLFVHYPNEWLISEEGDEVVSNDLISEPSARPWDYILQMVLNKKIIKLPPASSDVIQNKGLLALMWQGVINNSIDTDTAEMIQTLIPPTFCFQKEAEEFGLNRFWEKPIYGREGAGVVLYQDGEVLVDTYSDDFEDLEWYQNMPAIFQKDCPMPVIEYADTKLTLMFTVYLSAQGKATGISCRASKGLGETAIDSKNGIWYPISLN